MYALTIWQPWAWLISAGHKLVENRDWLPSWKLLKEGDDLAIHSAVREPSRIDVQEARLRARLYGGVEFPSSDSTELGTHFGRGRVVAVRFVGVKRSREEIEERQRVWWVGSDTATERCRAAVSEHFIAWAIFECLRTPRASSRPGLPESSPKRRA